MYLVNCRKKIVQLSGTHPSEYLVRKELLDPQRLAKRRFPCVRHEKGIAPAIGARAALDIAKRLQLIDQQHRGGTPDAQHSAQGGLIASGMLHYIGKRQNADGT